MTLQKREPDAQSLKRRICPISHTEEDAGCHFRCDGACLNLIGLSKTEIREALEEAGLDARQAKLRAKQLWHQIYNRGATDFATMSDIAKPHRTWLAERFVIARPAVVTELVSTDGTRKWLRWL